MEFIWLGRRETWKTYNIGGENEKTNLEIADILCTILDKKYRLKIL